MKRKINCVLVCIMVLVLSVSMLNAAAADVTYSGGENELKLLKALDIACFDTSDMILSEGIGKGDFITMILNVFTDNKYKKLNSEAAELAYALGIISSPSEKTNVFIGYNEAVEMLMKMLGYPADKSAVNSKYLSVKRNLTNGTKAFGKYLRAGDAMIIMRQFIKTDILQIVSVSVGDIKLKAYDGETPITVYRGIYETSGIVDGTYETTLFGGSAIKSGRVSIDAEIYRTKYAPEEFIGYSVNAFVKKVGGEEPGEVLYIEKDERKNTTLTIDAEDIKTVENLKNYKYYNEDGKEKTAKLSSSYKLIYNGVALEEYTQADMIPAEGEVTLINNDGDSLYDIVKVTSYENMLVSYVATSSKRIGNKLAYTGATETLDLDKSDPDTVLTLEKNGMEISVGDISEDDTVTFTKSRGTSGRTVIKAYVSSQQYTGIISEVDISDGEAVIDGVRYELSDEIKQGNTQGVKYLKIPSVGRKVTAYVNTFGKICAFSALSDNIYGYAKKWWTTDKTNETVVIKLFNTDGDWDKLTLSKKVIFNGTKMAAKDMFLERGDIEPQLIRYRVNEDGIIKELSFATITNERDTEDFSCMAQKSLAYRTQNSSFNHEIFVGDACVMWWIPQNPLEADEDSFMVIDKSWLTADLQYTFTPYDVDAFNSSNQIVVAGDDSFLSERKINNTVIVEGIKKALKGDGTVGTIITGMVESYSDFSIFVSDELDVSDIKKGDFLQVFINSKGEISNYIRYYSLEEGCLKPQLAISSIHTSNPIGYFSGMVLKTNPSEMRMLVEIDTTGVQLASKGASTTRISVVDTSETNIRLSRGTYNDIEPGDKVFVAMKNSGARDIYVIKN